MLEQERDHDQADPAAVARVPQQLDDQLREALAVPAPPRAALAAAARRAREVLGRRGLSQR